MREIKFRWWDFAEEEMLSEYDLDNRIIDSGEDGYFHFMKVARYHPLQYTGLKDKNGVEIYEGDILHQEKYPTPDMRINFIAGCFVGVSTNEIQEINWEPSKLTKLQELDYEVIGNIYEHPYLLEVSTK